MSTEQILYIFGMFVTLLILVIVLIIVTNFIGIDRARRDQRDEADRDRMAELTVRNQQVSSQVASSLALLAEALDALAAQNKPKL